jgi:hypothetical protein
MSTETTVLEPEANETTEQQPADEQASFDREYVEKLRKEAATYRTKLRHMEEATQAAQKEAERAKMDDLQKLQAELEDARKAAQEKDQLLRRERDARALTGKVVDVDAALRLLDDDFRTDDGVDVDAFLKKYAFMTAQVPAAEPEAPRRTPAANATQTPGAGPLKPDDFRGKPIDWVRANLHRLKE